MLVENHDEVVSPVVISTNLARPNTGLSLYLGSVRLT